MADISNIYDVALKQKLLHSVLRDYVPEYKHPFRSPSELSYVVSTIKTDKLLFESAPGSQDLLDGWKAAVDSWVHSLLTLGSSNLPDKCWAGISLLGVTCQECSSERFLASYSLWLNKLLSHIQPPSVSHFVRVAACAALSSPRYMNTDTTSLSVGFAAFVSSSICTARMRRDILKELENIKSSINDGKKSVSRGNTRQKGVNNNLQNNNLCQPINYAPMEEAKQV